MFLFGPEFMPGSGDQGAGLYWIGVDDHHRFIAMSNYDIENRLRSYSSGPRIGCRDKVTYLNAADLLCCAVGKQYTSVGCERVDPATRCRST